MPPPLPTARGEAVSSTPGIRMRRNPLESPAHEGKRVFLRAAGMLLAAAGAVLTGIGFVSFFQAFGGSEPPTRFWCAFLGLPLLGIGLSMMKLGYLGTISRYVAEETAPVAVDTLNYVARETKDALRESVAHIASGLSPAAAASRNCPHCNRPTPGNANFCGDCGGALPRVTACPQCRRSNGADARYCAGCGTQLAS
jgi:hypothetical protein